MDQLRTAMAWIVRYHFWLLCLVVAAVALGCWYSAASALSKQYAANKRKIESEFNAQRQFQQKPFHPNDAVNRRQEQEIEKQAEQVLALWQQLYDRQREVVLRWPKALGPSFLRYIEDKKFGDEIIVELRRRYQNYAKDYFPELPKIVQAKELDPSERGGSRMGSMMGGGRGFDMQQYQQMMMGSESSSRRGYSRRGEAGEEELPQDDFIVVWADQARIREQLTFDETPSHIRIWVTQEDLWVYETMLRVIARTNEAAGADRMSNAAVRVIQSLEVGQLAARTANATGRIYMPEPAAPGGMMGGYGPEMGGMEGGYGEMMGGYGAEMGGMEGGYGEMMGGYAEFGAEMGGMGGEAAENAQLLSRRYLDAEGNPITVEGEASDMNFGVEYKQLPVRMSLIMDQRWLARLIVECANAPLQIEVQEVRINPADGGSGGGGGYGRRRGMMGGGGGMFGEGGGGYGSAAPMTFDPQPNVVPVIIQGTVYIFNEPDVTQLTVGEDDTI